VLLLKNNLNKLFTTVYFKFILVILSVLLYFITLNNNFLADDYYIISDLFTREDSNIQLSVSNLVNYLSFSAGGGFYWRPTTFLVFALNGLIWGINSIGYHLFSVLLLAIGSILVNHIALRFLNPLYSGICSLLFIFYPLHTEAVSLINAVADPLGTVFSLFMILFWMKFRETNRLYFSMISIMSFILALLTKEFALVLPGILVLYEIYINETNFKNMIKRNFFLFFLMGLLEVGYFTIRKVVAGSTLDIVQTYPPSFTVLKSLLSIPFGFSFLPLGVNGSLGRNLYIGISIIIVTLIFSMIIKKDKKIMLFTGWFLISLMPSYLFLPSMLDYYLVPNTRFLYFSSVFIVIAIVYVIQKIIKPMYLKAAVLVFLSLLYVAGLYKSTLVWEQSSMIVKSTNEYLYQYVKGKSNQAVCVNLENLYFMNGATAYFNKEQIGLGLKEPFYDVEITGGTPKILKISNGHNSGDISCSEVVTFYLKMNAKGQPEFTDLIQKLN